MKSILLIGAGNFGSYLTRELAKQGNEIMLVDKNERAMEDLLPLVTSAKIGDCTDLKVLKSLGVPSFDVCFVCIGSDGFQSSLEITSQLKELGAKYVISKTDQDLHAKFLLRNGADEIVYPERDIAERLAVSVSHDSVFGYFELESGISVYEITPLPDWLGKTIRALNLRANYNINIIGISKDDSLTINPSPDYIFRSDEHLFVVGPVETISKLLQTIKP